MKVSASRPVITLTTDFGLSDHYAGVMKCVISRICPEAHVIDVSHLIEPADIISAAYTVSQLVPYSPSSAVHVVVVDPGVGTSRKAIGIRTGGQIFIAPDNGVLSLVLKPDAEIRELGNPKLWLEPRSNTFHGRDLFAPAAALVASGQVTWEALGPALSTCLVIKGVKAIEEQNGWMGMVLKVDHFGNAVTNFPSTLIPRGGTGRVEGEGFTIERLFDTFGDARDAEPFLYRGSSGNIEIGIDRGRAAERLGLKSGFTLRLLLAF